MYPRAIDVRSLHRCRYPAMLAYALTDLEVRAKNFWLVNVTQPRQSHWFTGQKLHGLTLTGFLMSLQVLLFLSGCLYSSHLSLTCSQYPSSLFEHHKQYNTLSMADILGAVGAGIALCTTLTQCGLAIRRATKRIKNSRRDIAELSNETVIFAGLCEDFLRTCADDHQAKSSAFSSIGTLNIWIERTITGLRKLLRKVEALRPDPRYRYSIQDTLIAHLEWFFSKDAVKSLRASLTIARANMTGFSNLMCIRKLNEELRWLKCALTNKTRRKEIENKLGMRIENKIDIVQQAM